MYDRKTIISLLEKLGIDKAQAQKYIETITRKIPFSKEQILETLQKDLQTIIEKQEKIPQIQKQWIKQEIQNQKPPIKTHLIAHLLRQNKTIKQILKQLTETKEITITKLWEKDLGGYVETVAWSPDGKYLAVGGSFRKVIVFDQNGGKIWDSGDLGNWVRCVSWSPDGKYLAAGTL